MVSSLYSRHSRYFFSITFLFLPTPFLLLTLLENPKNLPESIESKGNFTLAHVQCTVYTVQCNVHVHCTLYIQPTYSLHTLMHCIYLSKIEKLDINFLTLFINPFRLRNTNYLLKLECGGGLVNAMITSSPSPPYKG